MLFFKDNGDAYVDVELTYDDVQGPGINLEYLRYKVIPFPNPYKAKQTFTYYLAS